MKKLFVWITILMVFCGCHVLGSRPALGLLPVPIGQSSFRYDAIASPIPSDDYAAAFPVGVGDCAAGGDRVDVQVHLNKAAGRIDIYFAVAIPELTSEIYILTPDNGLQEFSKVGLVPWQADVTGPINASPFGIIPLNQLPAGTYYFGLIITPAGDQSNYTLWLTSLEISNASDCSGLYYVTLSVQPQWKMIITQSNGRVAFSLSGNKYLFKGQGRITGNSMLLTAEVPSMEGTFNAALNFTDLCHQFSGTWVMQPVGLNGTISGTQTPWPTFDTEAQSLPHFITDDVVELDKIARVSKFRSGAGHDYSDDFETCRSMKHYFVAKPEVDRLSVKIFSPLDGVVIATTEEWFPGVGWKGTNIGIQSEAYPAFHVVIMHVDLITPLHVGDRVLSGQLLGTPPPYENVTLADTAVGVNTPNGYKLISFFEVITQDVLKNYQARGLKSRQNAIITQAERDGDPLICQGEEEFKDGGNLENWIYLH